MPVDGDNPEQLQIPARDVQREFEQDDGGLAKGEEQQLDHGPTSESLGVGQNRARLVNKGLGRREEVQAATGAASIKSGLESLCQKT